MMFDNSGTIHYWKLVSLWNQLGLPPASYLIDDQWWVRHEHKFVYRPEKEDCANFKLFGPSLGLHGLDNIEYAYQIPEEGFCFDELM